MKFDEIGGDEGTIEEEGGEGVWEDEALLCSSSSVSSLKRWEKEIDLERWKIRLLSSGAIITQLNQ